MKENPIRKVLLIEDNPGDARLLHEMFKEPGLHAIELTHVPCMVAAEKYLGEQRIDIVLLDLGLPDAQGLEAVRRTRAAAPRIPLVVLSGLDDESMAVQALQEGAQDYLIKGQIEPRELLRALRYAIERNAIEDTLFTEKERAQVTLNSIGDAVICTDMSGNITFINIVAEKLTGRSLREVYGQPMTQAFQVIDSINREVIRNPMDRAIEQDRTCHLSLNCILIRRDGFEIYIEDSVAPIHDRAGEITGAVVVFRDVSVARSMAIQIAHSARHDFLTGLPNRLLLNDRIAQAIALAHRDDKRIALMFLDLDGFKHINDSLGHPVGDRLLQSVAKRLQLCVRGCDTVSRQGGDEFVVLLTEMVHPENSAAAARRMLDAVAEVHSIGDKDLHITTSIGVSVYPDDGMDPETLIKSADTAMYQAKENGRQSYQFFRPAMNVRAVERQSMEEHLRRAMERNELALHYQPVVNLTTGVISGAEALLRWTHPERGPVSPAQFIPVAEDCGLILPIGAWVMREACTQARAWTNAGLPAMTIAVNVSAMQFRNGNFLEEMFSILEETGLDPKYLELELTESALMKNAGFTASILQILRERGIQVAVDDFGTGYSSLGYLQRFPLDALKIDQSFIRQISAAPNETAIVTAIIRMGQSLNLRVIAEGVETQEELAFLQNQQCNEAQGYYFSRPVPPLEFSELLKLPALQERKHNIRTASCAQPNYRTKNKSILVS
jgi:diguanylate cyclase (GGDEF)-like protein/PAS domain S-box-containing protein